MQTQLILLLFFCICSYVNAQSTPQDIDELRQKLDLKRSEFVKIENEWEALELAMIQAKCKKIGYPIATPGSEALKVITRDGFIAGFSPKHQQSQWVMHMVLSDISSRCWNRTDDFRADTLLEGSPTIEDYKFGDKKLDKGHLAPAADFRWCNEAVSASFLLTNMSPQPSDYNRGIWAELEKTVRSYLTVNPNTELFVVTGPVLEDNLKKLNRDVAISLPKKYYKVLFDPKRNRGIAYLLKTSRVNPSSYRRTLEKAAMSINALEDEIGLNFFPNMEAASQIESTYEPFFWLPFIKSISPIPKSALDSGQINTTMLNSQEKGDTIIVQGTIVDASLSKSGNITLFIDRKFPEPKNQLLFKTLIQKRYFKDYDSWKSTLFNTTNLREEQLDKLIGQKVSITGKLSHYKPKTFQPRESGKPFLYTEFFTYLRKPSDIRILE